MGASSSADKASSSSTLLQEQESLAASTGSLPFLRSAFSSLSSSSSSQSSSVPLSSLVQTFSLDANPNSSPSLPQLSALLSAIGPAVASLLFGTASQNDPASASQNDPASASQNDPASASVSWLDFVAGYNKCCARMPASASIALLLELYSECCKRAEIPCKIELDSDSGKVSGALAPRGLEMMLTMCWCMERSWRVSGRGIEGAILPELRQVVAAAMVASGEVGEEDERIWGEEILGMEKSISAQKVQMWAVSSVPGLANCFSRFVQEKLKASPAAKENYTAESVMAAGGPENKNTLLLTCGRAWAMSLTLRNAVCEELSHVSFAELVSEAVDNILYRSSVHGRGLNRFWSSIEGYHGPMLILISASSVESSQSSGSTKRWMVGILTEHGFENRETFYGNSGFIYAVDPVFRVFSPSGKEKNFVYSHLHPTGRVYEPNPKPGGLAFGGTLGSERILIDEDFAKVTVRHHAIDKTYHHGSLFPDQGFLPVEASVLEVEVWGFGGNAAKGRKDAFKKRETLFTEQRRKVDLKTFGGWEDSPEKMMMDMVSDPNSARREER